MVDIPPNLVWAAWTRPDYIKTWFTLAPWQTIDCNIETAWEFSIVYQSRTMLRPEPWGKYIEETRERSPLVPPLGLREPLFGL